MAATELSTASPGRWLPAGVAGAWLRAYTAICAATVVFAALIVAGGPGLAQPVRRILGAQLTPRNNPPPSLGHVLALAAHNIPIATWPLLLGVMGAYPHRLTWQFADTLVVACLLVNVLPVGAALGAYGTPLLPYVPQLPLEWAGLALGAGSWLVQRDRELTGRERLMWLAVTAGVLLCAAVLETVAVPHR
jgi:lysylphosphatidylglycerol synthetase-like protein (DUF2156 family)